MGNVNNDLIPAGVLLNHPNLTCDQFVAELDKTRSAEDDSCTLHDEWDQVDPKFESGRFHAGLFGLSQVLRLKRQGIYNVLEAAKGHTSHLLIVPRKKNNEWIEPLHIVHHDEPRPSLKFLGSIGDEPDATGIRHMYNAVQQIRIPSQKEGAQKQQYDSFSSFIAEHPQLHPAEIFDFSQKEGSFGFERFPQIEKGIPWKQVYGKYSLDTDRIRTEWKENTFGSIVITAEAIRLGAWNVLCYGGYKHTQRFLADFPDAQKRHDKTIFHLWLTKYFVKQGGTNIDFLRFLTELRLNAPVIKNKKQELDLQLLINEVIADLPNRREWIWKDVLFNEADRADLLAHYEQRGEVTTWLRAYLTRRSEELQIEFPPQLYSDQGFRNTPEGEDIPF